MEFRHEWKHPLPPGCLPLLRRRLGTVLRPDSHGEGGRYRVRSLYFDTPSRRALREKLDGVDGREKFRLRLYGGDTALIRLEKKSKRSGLCRKESVRLTAEETAALLAGRRDWVQAGGRDLVWELCRQMRNDRLKPRMIVDYTREAWVYGPGNVRVTLDYDLRAGRNCLDFLSREVTAAPVLDAPAVLEVKWDAFLPDVVRAAVHLDGLHTAAFSKYAACGGIHSFSF